MPTETGNATWDSTTGPQARREAMIASVIEPAEREELHRLLRRFTRAFPDEAHPYEGHDFGSVPFPVPGLPGTR